MGENSVWLRIFQIGPILVKLRFGPCFGKLSF
jgi:hypothetical protein